MVRHPRASGGHRRRLVGARVRDELGKSEPGGDGDDQARQQGECPVTGHVSSSFLSMGHPMMYRAAAAVNSRIRPEFADGFRRDSGIMELKTGPGRIGENQELDDG